MVGEARQDNEGQVISEINYTYDYLGNRTSKTANGQTTYYINDLSSGLSQVLKEEDEKGKKTFYVRGLELILSEDEDIRYYLTDGCKTVRGLINTEGKIEDTYVFDSYGNPISSQGDTGSSYGYKSERLDATGLYYLRARYMDPNTGMFLTQDSYEGSLESPISQHKYLFANANPVMNSDPTGYSSLAEQVSVLSIQEVLWNAYESAMISAMLCTLEGCITGGIYDEDFETRLVKSLVFGAISGCVGYSLSTKYLAGYMLKSDNLGLLLCAYFILSTFFALMGFVFHMIGNEISDSDNVYISAFGDLIGALGDSIIDTSFSFFGQYLGNPAVEYFPDIATFTYDVYTDMNNN